MFNNNNYVTIKDNTVFGRYDCGQSTVELPQRNSLQMCQPSAGLSSHWSQTRRVSGGEEPGREVRGNGREKQQRT